MYTQRPYPRDSLISEPEPGNLHLTHAARDDGSQSGFKTLNPRTPSFNITLGLQVICPPTQPPPHFTDAETEARSRKRTQSSCRSLTRHKPSPPKSRVCSRGKDPRQSTSNVMDLRVGFEAIHLKWGTVVQSSADEGGLGRARDGFSCPATLNRELLTGQRHPPSPHLGPKKPEGQRRWRFFFLLLLFFKHELFPAGRQRDEGHWRPPAAGTQPAS